MPESERWNIIFFGHVQSVGFRFRSKYAADGFGLSGWVQNLWDGTVEMEVQGTPDNIRRLITLLQGSPYILIEDMRIKKIPLEAESGFHIR